VAVKSLVLIIKVTLHWAHLLPGCLTDGGQVNTISVCGLEPKFHYADFYRNFPTGKVVDTNHESRGQTVTNHETMKFR